MQLKFRAWDDNNKIFHYWGYDIQSTIYGLGVFTSPLNPAFPSTQFTNHLIHDKELYAGDIIRNEKMDDYEDAVEYLVCTYILEWAMFGLLTIDEYHKYNSEGAEALDEYMFWTFPIDDKENEQRRICGNIYEIPNLLSL